MGLSSVKSNWSQPGQSLKKKRQELVREEQKGEPSGGREKGGHSVKNLVILKGWDCQRCMGAEGGMYYEEKGKDTSKSPEEKPPLHK